MLSALLFFSLCIDIPKQRIDGPMAQRAHEYIQSQQWFSGSVMLVVEDRIVLHHAYGYSDASKTIPNSTDTRFGIASISKQFAASAILLLVDQGKLSLEDTLPKFFDAVPADKQNITIHHLLSHTAGFPNNYAADGIRKSKQAAKAILSQELQFPVGQKFRYTGDGFILATLIVEKVSGQPYDLFLSEHVLHPANLYRTLHWASKAFTYPNEVAQPAQWPEARYMRPNYGFRGCTGLFSTTGDLYRWFRALMTDQVLSAAAREKMLSPSTPFSRGHVGYGWFMEPSKGGRPTIWTRGSESMGYSASIIHFPNEKVQIIIACNVPETDDRPSGARALDRQLEAVIFP